MNGFSMSTQNNDENKYSLFKYAETELDFVTVVLDRRAEIVQMNRRRCGGQIYIFPQGTQIRRLITCII
jgi:hypothetical protein